MRPPFATYGLISANVIVFLIVAVKVGSVSMDNAESALTILQWGANVNPLTLGGQPWRLFSSMFLHFGVWHLAINMVALFSMGSSLEQGVGPIRFLLIYFFTGVVANLFSLLLNVYVNSAGASGALFGLYGYTLAASLITHDHDGPSRTRLLGSFVFFVIVNTLIAFIASVDIWAHVGGFIGGIALSLLHFRLRRLIGLQQLALALAAAVALVFVLPRDQVRYYRMFQKVLTQERRTNGYYRQELSDAEMSDSLTHALHAWEKIDSSFALMGKVREKLRHDSSRLHQYARINRQLTSYNLSLRTRQSYVYLDSVEAAHERYGSVGSLDYNLNYFPGSESPPSPADSAATNGLMARRVFYDGEWREIEDPSIAVYYRLGQVDSSGRWQGAVRDYYRNGDIQMKGGYVDGLKDGVFLYYSDHGTYTSAGRYVREESVGKWETFHWNGALEAETYYGDKAFVATVLDSLGNVQVKDGNGTVTSWHENGRVAETGRYFNGMRTGDWLGYHPDGTPYYREQYRDNRLVGGVSVDLSGKRFVYDELSQFAYPENGMEHFQRYVSAQMRRPASNITGIRIKVLFQVGKTGDQWDHVILEGHSPEYEQEAIRLIKEGPTWRQGLLHGHIPVPSQGYAVIDF